MGAKVAFPAPQTLTTAGGATVTGSAGSITLTGAGTNQNINLTPSGTGDVVTTTGAVRVSGAAAGTGKVILPAATTSAGGINLGNEIYLYRTGTNTANIDASAGLTMSGAVVSATGVHSATAGGSGGASYNAMAPLTLAVKSVTIKTSATPADIATITIPSGITRYRVINSQMMAAIAETASGTLAAANVKVQDAASGLGNNIVAAFAMPASASTMTSAPGASSTQIITSSTLYLNQTSNSANAGTVSFYIQIQPLP